jgi:hypothetical protein
MAIRIHRHRWKRPGLWRNHCNGMKAGRWKFQKLNGRIDRIPNRAGRACPLQRQGRTSSPPNAALAAAIPPHRGARRGRAFRSDRYLDVLRSKVKAGALETHCRVGKDVGPGLRRWRGAGAAQRRRAARRPSRACLLIWAVTHAACSSGVRTTSTTLPSRSMSLLLVALGGSHRRLAMGTILPTVRVCVPDRKHRRQAPSG